MSNHDRMEYLRDKIDEYRGYISELEEACAFVNDVRAEIRSDNEEPIKRFNISSAGSWEGKLETEAEDRRNDIVCSIAAGQNLASDFISDVQNIIERLHEKIEDYESELSSLEAAQDESGY
ncbi:DUF5082 domain-containing protein [Butyrivibrio sp. M55]|uniref:DUF5082 domain-containing protein n=1 Tax=Butyrivibrio sp. M55 TaxID=1855323 RepID=UPI0008F3B989|nr:DUF5082 domain-containing protein [Butyrivibrio sp. M55]SFU33134.1 protein of unknown function [Butyrivibrio sp. M55]